MLQTDISYLIALYANDSARSVYGQEKVDPEMLALHISLLDTLTYALLCEGESGWLTRYLNEAVKYKPYVVTDEYMIELMSLHLYNQLTTLLSWSLHTRITTTPLLGDNARRQVSDRISATISEFADEYNSSPLTTQLFDIEQLTKRLTETTDEEPIFTVE